MCQGHLLSMLSFQGAGVVRVLWSYFSLCGYCTYYTYRYNSNLKLFDHQMRNSSDTTLFVKFRTGCISVGCMHAILIFTL